MAPDVILSPLKAWFLKNKRSFPWRKNTSPYAVWISEVMLQQTKASVVIPYFNRWMEKFPTIEILANAEIEEVIKLWEGLGYYSRARNIHTAAQTIKDRYGGELPKTQEELLKIKGLGPYTEAAIRSFAFRQKAAAVDGNVERVIARYFQLEDDVLKTSTKAKIRTLTYDLLPEKEPWITMEALIELGATICQKKPLCSRCPLQTECLAYKTGQPSLLPFKSKKTKIEKLYREVAVIYKNDKILLQKGAKGKVMADLFEFPYLSTILGGLQGNDVAILFNQTLNLRLKWISSLPVEKQHFTRYEVLLYPHVFETDEEKTSTSFEWISCESIHELPFSSGHKRILQGLT